MPLTNEETIPSESLLLVGIGVWFLFLFHNVSLSLLTASLAPLWQYPVGISNY
ncbi:hypothetical protein BDW66DRAFT_127051 [Aspergillus desertorum]